MPFIRVWIDLIWSTKNREPTISRELLPQLLDHVRENAKEKNILLDSIDAVSDHAHALISLRADQTIARIAQLLKGESAHWVNQKNLTRFKFEWQDEYIAISVSESAVDTVRAYIKNQEEHHRKKSFGEEYQEFLKEYGFEILQSSATS
ncbi:MAG: transposase [Ignavibacteriales bacterium]|nr:transposase [Ignavibacteriales bacterium]